MGTITIERLDQVGENIQLLAFASLFSPEYRKKVDALPPMQERLQEREQKGIEKGIEKGRQEELEKMLHRMLTRRFGAVPPELSERIRQLTIAQKKGLLDVILDAASLDDVWDHMPCDG